MVTTTRRIEERGQRTPRTLSSYQVGEGMKGTAYCECGAVFRGKRWLSGENISSDDARKVVCPACRRTADDNPAGIVVMTGDYLSTHQDELSGLVEQIGQAVTQRNRLSRIMKITREAAGITVATTDAKLAQKIGRDIFKSHHGELNFTWSDNEEYVRVNWKR